MASHLNLPVRSMILEETKVHINSTPRALLYKVMPSRKVRYTMGVGFLLVALLVWIRISDKSSPAKLEVAFVGMTNNPTYQPPAPRIVIPQGATGLCAMFWVTNVTARQYLWFRTAFAEQKTPTGWQPVINSPSAWRGIGGSVWSPGYGCLFAVSWPPGLSTNATWRLQVSYGQDPSLLGMLINEKAGRNIFKAQAEEATILSTEVNP